MGLISKLFGNISANNASNANNISFKNETERKLYKTNIEYRKMKDRIAENQATLEQQNELLRIACDAREKYKNDGDIESAIAAYEKVYYEANPPLKNAQSHAMFLADLYIKNGQHDKAWGFLGMLQTKELCPLSKIRGEQAKILKKEKKHKDAIETILLQHWNIFFESEYKYFNHNACMKDIGPSIRALKWSFEDQERCVGFVEYATSLKEKASEATIVDLFRKFVEQKGT